MKFALSFFLIAIFCCFIQCPVAQAQDWDDSASQEEFVLALRALELRHRELESMLHGIEERAEAVDEDDRIQVLRIEIAGLEVENEMKAIRQKAEVIEKRLHAERGEHREGNRENPQHSEIDMARRKLEHLRAAYEHLREAGLQEMANDVVHHIRRLEERIHQASREENESEGDSSDKFSYRGVSDREFRDEVIGAIRELNNAVREIQHELRQLRREREGSERN